MNNFKRISAIILALCTMTTVFYSCSKNENTTDISATETANKIVETVTEIETVEVEVTDEKGNVSVSVSEKIVTIPVTKKETALKTEKDNTAAKLTTTKKTDKSDTAQVSSAVTQISSAITTIKTPLTTKKAEANSTKAPATTKKRPVVDDKINEKSVGISMLSKTDPVNAGSQANIIIQGTPGKTYSIEFYETPTSVAKMSELKDQKSDANGFVKWTFEIRNTCNLGKRKVIIKEENSDNYIETSITVK